MTNAAFASRDASSLLSDQRFALNKALFASPAPAGRKITAGFSFLQRIGKEANIDVWFPERLKEELNTLVDSGVTLGPQHFPAEWAAVRQFELLQEAGNYKIYDMDATHITRTMMDLARSMKGGGYRVTVATLGSYVPPAQADDLEILDRRLQDRISRLIHMLYLDEQSGTFNRQNDAELAEGKWNYQDALPHVGVTLGARNIFMPGGGPKSTPQTSIIPPAPHLVMIGNWAVDAGVAFEGGVKLARVQGRPQQGQYSVAEGVYRFSASDVGRDIVIHYVAGGAKVKSQVAAARRHKLAQQFFDIVGLLPQNHIVHDTAVGLQLPELIGENEWIYLAPSDETLGCFNTLLTDLFAPFDGISMAALDGREDAKSEIKGTVQHMRSYGDRLTPEADAFYRSAARYSLQ